MKICSVILARGGSKGIPKKNIQILNGKPLIFYTLNSSIRSEVDETWVCTDDLEIAEVSELYGAKTLIRPKEISTDKSKSEESLLFFSEKIDFDLLVFIQPTSPLLTPDYINLGIKMMIEKKFDSVFSAYKEHWLPRWELGNELQPINWDISSRPMRQEKKEVLVENGAFYITSKENLQKNKNRYGGKIGFVEMPQSKSFQVDNYDDLNLISKLL